MRVAIVGTSKLSLEETIKARKLIESIIFHYYFQVPVQIITGDASGIDEIVRTSSYRDIVKVHIAFDKSWEGERGFKARNTRIAQDADKVISITTNTKSQRCYHCNADHQRTGGCWTMKKAKELNKPTELFVL